MCVCVCVCVGPGSPRACARTLVVKSACAFVVRNQHVGRVLSSVEEPEWPRVCACVHVRTVIDHQCD